MQKFASHFQFNSEHTKTQCEAAAAAIVDRRASISVRARATAKPRRLGQCLGRRAAHNNDDHCHYYYHYYDLGRVRILIRPPAPSEALSAAQSQCARAIAA